MRVSHSFPAISATFDDPNLVSCAGLATTMALAQRAGLTDLVAHTLTLKGEGGANAHLKVPTLVAGMVAGADSIDDMDLLRHGGMGRLFTGVRAPSTLGTFLRSFTFGHVRQLDAVASRFLIALAKNAPVLPGADQVCYVDIDDTIKATHGYQKQGAGYGYCADLMVMPTFTRIALGVRGPRQSGRHNPGVRPHDASFIRFGEGGRDGQAEDQGWGGARAGAVGAVRKGVRVESDRVRLCAEDEGRASAGDVALEQVAAGTRARRRRLESGAGRAVSRAAAWPRLHGILLAAECGAAAGDTGL